MEERRRTAEERKRDDECQRETATARDDRKALPRIRRAHKAAERNRAGRYTRRGRNQQATTHTTRSPMKIQNIQPRENFSGPHAAIRPARCTVVSRTTASRGPPARPVPSGASTGQPSDELAEHRKAKRLPQGRASSRRSRNVNRVLARPGLVPVATPRPAQKENDHLIIELRRTPPEQLGRLGCERHPWALFARMAHARGRGGSRVPLYAPGGKEPTSLPVARMLTSCTGGRPATPQHGGCCRVS